MGERKEAGEVKDNRRRLSVSDCLVEEGEDETQGESLFKRLNDTKMRFRDMMAQNLNKVA
jgi:hypothetical protein